MTPPEMAEPRPDRVVLALAGRRHGVITTAELADAGLGKDAVTNRVRRGWLRRLHRGVYLVGPLEAPLTRAAAAVAACGTTGVLSHASAAALWGLCPPPTGPVDIIAGRAAHSRDGIRVHHDTLHPADITTHHQIPVTSPARTLLDLATRTTPRELDRAVNEARVLHLVTDLSLDEQFSRYQRHRGTAAVKEATKAEPRLTRSEAERRLLELIRAAGLPPPETNVRIAGYEVDFLWRAQRLIVEVDGYAFHSARSSFERDRRKQADLAAAGLRVATVTWQQLIEETIAVVARLATALAA
jgi:predicted transcriptional regulator of viral defense system